LDPLDKLFEALASRPRREILGFLSDTPLTTSELAARFAVSAPAISRHLSVLENAGLVTAERDGRRVLYRLNHDYLVEMLARFSGEIAAVPAQQRVPREPI
jgi:ArsR family transcriptional regulator, arsenate/arsenite/antimonite-responsive transcriptional repressor